MHLLTLKQLMLYFTNPLVNVAFKFHVVSFTHTISHTVNTITHTGLKVETQSVQVCWICTTFRYNQTQLRTVEALSLEHHMVYPRLCNSSYELERPISHSNLTIYKHWNEEKILRKFTNKYLK